MCESIFFFLISGFYAIGYHGRLLVDIAIVLSQTGMCIYILCI
jgi:hypothetical protein